MIKWKSCQERNMEKVNVPLRPTGPLRDITNQVCKDAAPRLCRKMRAERSPCSCELLDLELSDQMASEQTGRMPDDSAELRLSGARLSFPANDRLGVLSGVQPGSSRQFDWVRPGNGGCEGLVCGSSEPTITLLLNSFLAQMVAKKDYILVDAKISKIEDELVKSDELVKMDVGEEKGFNQKVKRY
eukprot:GFUD01044720.1.p1 GENE.GFUD01044720.1~~GFUD01044720.1.p1  ORF type:complete len:186 (-),score=25.78 GFUD01044720.1:310-867(-)